MKKIKNLIFIFESFLTKYDFERYGFNFYESQGVDIKILNVSPITRINYFNGEKEKSHYIKKFQKNCFSLEDLKREVFNSCQIIINCSPIGTYPKLNECPNIPYQYIDSRHICYDLIYNPEETQFLKKSRLNKALVINGMKMLELQAEESWKIWNS